MTALKTLKSQPAATTVKPSVYVRPESGSISSGVKSRLAEVASAGVTTGPFRTDCFPIPQKKKLELPNGGATDCWPLPKTTEQKKLDLPPLGRTDCWPLPQKKDVNVFDQQVITANYGAARNLKDAINGDSLGRALNKKTLPFNERPVEDNGQTYSPNGARLLEVKLNDGQSAYVDPTTNQYYVKKEALLGNTRMSFTTYEGPYDLPKNAQFQGENFPESQLDGFEVAANTTFR